MVTAQSIEIHMGFFHDFDHNGEVIHQFVPVEWDLRVGEKIRWTCVQFEGTAEVTSVLKVLKTHLIGLKRIT